MQISKTERSRRAGLKLVAVSVIIALFAALLAVTLKRSTEHYEHVLYGKASSSPFLFFIFPLCGLSLIYLLRYYLFKKKENKGIREVFDSTRTGKKLAPYKIPSHYINGMLTVCFGGSTGIEVSTVVSSAAVGSLARQKESLFRMYKTELICAGVTAGITALFCTPFAGILFAYEVISKRAGKTFLVSNIIAALVSFGLITLFGEKPLFPLVLNNWHLYAIPYFLLLGILAGMNSVHLTKIVIYTKSLFGRINSHYYKIAFGAVIISLAVYILPQLYGDGYHAIRENILSINSQSLTLPTLVTILGILILKPVITSITLSAGGDGGVFAPSIFMGAFLGLLVAVVLNSVFHAGVIPLNFMVAGMAAMLSASIHAPFTALFLICGVTGNYSLFIPLTLSSFAAKATAKLLCPYNVYTYSPVTHANKKD